MATKLELVKINNLVIESVLDKVKTFSKLDVDEQILYMKYKGISFNHINECDAKNILSNNTYYYKVTAFRKNFIKKNDKYVNLDFGILNDLATIDMYLRYISIKLLLDIEHVLKSELIHTITRDATENGYSIIEQFDEYSRKLLMERMNNFDPSRYKEITTIVMNRNKNRDGYHYDIYHKRKNNPPIWVLLELMSFGELIRFLEFYYDSNKFNKKKFDLAYDLLKYTKNFRDASAHSRPLILNLTNFNNLAPSQKVTQFASKAKIKKADRKKYLSNKKLHDFVCILIIHDHYIKAPQMKVDRKTELQLLKKRCLKRFEYYHNQTELKNIYKVFSKVVDKYNA
ncbi:MAG: Abi family protein [Bacillota bacterium]